MTEEEEFSGLAIGREFDEGEASLTETRQILLIRNTASTPNVPQTLLSARLRRQRKTTGKFPVLPLRRLTCWVYLCEEGISGSHLVVTDSYLEEGHPKERYIEGAPSPTSNCSSHVIDRHCVRPFHRTTALYRRPLRIQLLPCPYLRFLMKPIDAGGLSPLPQCQPS